MPTVISQPENTLLNQKHRMACLAVTPVYFLRILSFNEVKHIEQYLASIRVQTLIDFTVVSN